MEIKKADSKGRVTGFEPGEYYSVVRGHTGTGFALNKVVSSVEEPGSLTCDYSVYVGDDETCIRSTGHTGAHLFPGAK